ncbi:LOW QUALITY PROTEIN: mevalonate kinase-like [Mycetomoellerius zeteki]|uniref:LOW QUALITY PROTEIN: mevalonate kinase-like n=1 Tax=Mycetomoellerius zeteki TaxID=64791 RepID=UPI00084E8217|nr:PREDICTED: LOW QUALITY PROTEIN: mevalonate kinase-like [Trachymyrmex zeteki]
MYRFNLSAPGTVFLCEEPNRRNKTCIAASLDMRTTITFSSLPPAAVRRDFIEIDFPSIQLHVKISLRQFFIHFFGENLYDYTFSRVTLHEIVKNFITSMTDYDGIYEPSNQAHQLSLQAFFFLLILINFKENINILSSFIVKLSTELPIGENLGSSASLCAVCLAACFWRWSLLQKGIVLYEFGKQDLLKISNYAQDCDSVIYNSSTKIGTIISTYGMIKIFDGGVISTPRSKFFSNLPDMKILLVFSNVSQTTKIELLSEKSMKIQALENPSLLIDFILKYRSNISIKFIHMLDIIDKKTYNCLKGNNDSQSINIIDNYKTLLDIIHMNQGLLKALGMSHPNLDIICAIARSFSLAGKLASRGGGGYAFILLADSTDENIQDLITTFEAHNFPTKIVTLNCSGIRVE